VIAALVTLIVVSVTPAEVALASADRARVEPDHSLHGQIVYFSTSHLEGEQRAACESALLFMVASASQQQVLERCTPSKISETLYRVDLRNVQWKWHHFFHVVKDHSYYGASQYLYRADQFIVDIGDTTEGDGYYRLLLDNANPSRDDYLKLHGTNNDATFHFGIITRSKSAIGPAVSGLRLVQNMPTNTRGSMWGTRDSAKIDDKSDPLEHPENDFEHQAEEWIGMLPKVSLTTGDRAALMTFFLSDAKGKRQEEAPPNIVTDHLGFRGQSAIRNVGSCIGCHATGYLPPGDSELRQLIGNGLDLYATPKERAEKIERFHLSDAGKQLARDNEDILQGIRLVNGLSGEENAEAFRAVFDYYDADLDLERCALETHATGKDLASAIAYSNAKGINLGARVPALVHGGQISRASWEQSGYLKAALALDYWRRSK